MKRGAGRGPDAPRALRRGARRRALAEGGRDALERLPRLGRDAPERVEEARVGHPGAEVRPAVRLVLDRTEALALGGRELPARRPLEGREVELGLLLQALVEEAADRDVSLEALCDLLGLHPGRD